MSKKILVLPGDGIGPEIVAQAVRVMELLRMQAGLDVAISEAAVGGAAYDESGHPLPAATLALAKQADAILLGAVGLSLIHISEPTRPPSTSRMPSSA